MDTKRLLANIYRETGIQIDDSDPILAVAVINERMLDAALADLRKAMQAAGDQWAAQSVMNEESAKRAASKVITDASVWLVERFRETSEAASKKILADIKAEGQESHRASQLAVKAAWLSGAGGVVALAVAAGMVAGIF